MAGPPLKEKASEIAPNSEGVTSSAGRMRVAPLKVREIMRAQPESMILQIVSKHRESPPRMPHVEM
jgi:hypothetical protein